MDIGAWQTTVYGVTKSWTGLSDSHTHTLLYYVGHNTLCKILKDIEVSGHFTGFLRNLGTGQKQQLEWDMDQLTIQNMESNITRLYIVILFNFCAECMHVPSHFYGV